MHVFCGFGDAESDHWGSFGIHLETIWDPPGDVSEPTWGCPGVPLDPTGIPSDSNGVPLDPIGTPMDSVRGPAGSHWDPFGFHRDPNGFHRDPIWIP